MGKAASYLPAGNKNAALALIFDFLVHIMLVRWSKTLIFQYVQKLRYLTSAFERPDFKRMMGDIDSGKINCVITKDLSRFGREYIRVGYYLEFIFKQKDVRYISINENEDSEKGLSNLVPIKNLFNEWHAKDTSEKVKNAFRAKWSAGERLSSYAPIGYCKDPNRKNKLIIDPQTRWIIEKIFDLAAHGAGAAKITRTLIAERIPTPGWLNYTQYGTFANIYANAPAEKQYAWRLAQVQNILKDETYIGNTIHNRQTNISYKIKRQVRKPPEEWIKIEGTHEAIISREVFEQVQRLIQTRRRPTKDQSTQIFSGLVKCADCGWTMKFATNRQGKVPYSYFSCSKNAQPGVGCTAHYIRYDVLYPYVLSRLQHWSALAQQDEDKLLKQLLSNGSKERDANNKRIHEELSRSKKRLNEIDVIFEKLYVDRVSGILSDSNFVKMSARWQDEQEHLEQRITEIEDQLKQDTQNNNNAEKWVSLIKQYTGLSELTAPLLNTLIEKILVHESTRAEDGTKEQEVEIFYRFVGRID